MQSTKAKFIADFLIHELDVQEATNVTLSMKFNLVHFLLLENAQIRVVAGNMIHIQNPVVLLLINAQRQGAGINVLGKLVVIAITKAKNNNFTMIVGMCKVMTTHCKYYYINSSTT